MIRFLTGVLLGVVMATALGAHAQPVEADLAVDAAVAHGVPPGLMVAIGQCESGFNRHSMNPSGARGVFQLLPGGELNGFYARGYTNWEDPAQQANYVAERIREGGTGPWLASRSCWGRWD